MPTPTSRDRAPSRLAGVLNSLKVAAGVALLGVLLVACGSDSDPDPNVVSTDKGNVKGSVSGSVQSFLGIPFAAPPTGALRWKAPAPAAAWTGDRDATAFATHCPQIDTAFGRATNSAEDCLHLNVYRPTSGSQLPVMVYIHGGALFLGESEDYDPSALVGQGVVVVTVNYRLGALGFLAHPALSAEGAGASGNYGFMDQQAALQWVQTNIGKFGGDQSNVTIFGESAGGTSVHTHLASPLSRGLFHKAIVQSGSYTLKTPSLAAAEAKGNVFATAAGCVAQTAACLRALSPAQVLANQGAIIGGNGIVGNVDNKVLTQALGTAFATGAFNRVPVIEGTNANEYSLLSAFAFDFSAPVTAQTYAASAALVIGFYDATKTLAEVDAAYPVASFASPIIAIDRIGTDSAYSCPARAIVKMLSAYTPTYQYEFADPNPPMIYLPSTSSHPAGSWGAYHASEIQYVLKVTPSIPTPPAFTAAQQVLSTQMIGFWTQFAKTGSPNTAGSTLWPQYSAGMDTALLLDPAGVRTTTDFAARHRCQFWSGS